MIKIIDLIDIVDDLLLIDDVNVGVNDVKYVNSVTNANNNYFYWVNDIKYVKNINDVNDLLTIENLLYLLHFGAL